jgi:hypothetical protein
MSWHEFYLQRAMGKRGPKPVDIATLNAQEFKWYRALHLLRDGTQLRHIPAVVRLGRLETKIDLEWWRKATLKEIISLLRFHNDHPEVRKSFTDGEREWAELERERQVSRLEQQLKPKKIQAQAKRREIWEALIRAHTVEAVQKVCQPWERLADVQAKGFATSAALVMSHAEQFLRMKRNRRFPRSEYSDESRLVYIARGMAGVMMGLSPMTAIERLRNIRHVVGGPLWSDTDNVCKCWRCNLERAGEFWKALETRISRKGPRQ